MTNPKPDKTVLARARDIRLLTLDVDGVLTDGRLHYGPNGEHSKSFHVRDGHGIKSILAQGIHIAVISGRQSAITSQRMAELGIPQVFQKISDKLPVCKALAEELAIPLEQVAHVGDDTPDAPVMRAVGLGIAVADAHPDAQAAADWQTQLAGGQGAVREVCDLLLAARGATTSDKA
ncbi:MAG TPA: HAD hydrolase family protein [Gammaproteobacteria bacterium]|nr:HAD hydrolase family protein [Gammaproteobacteria bacterium]